MSSGMEVGVRRVGSIMDEETPSGTTPLPLVRSAVFVVVVLAVWAVLALRNPQLTYHFAPLIAAFVGPASLRAAGRIDATVALPVAAATSALVGLASVVLHVADAMQGPTFWNDGPALSEAVLFTVLGAVAGARVATRPNAGLLGSVFEA